MHLYLAIWPEGWGFSKNPSSRFVNGTIINEELGKLSNNMKLRMLLSYWYFKDVDLGEMLDKYYSDPKPDIFADSGAFSAMTQGVNITCKEYGDWVKKWKHLFTAYANLDVIRNAEATWENQQRLEGMGLEPVPVFHVAEKFSWLERYVDNYKYIALGVAGSQSKKNKVMAWITKCFRAGDDRVVFHGFGITSWLMLNSFRWYSVDSSSWGAGFRYGIISLFDYNVGRFYKVRLGNFEDCKRHAKLINAYGYEPIDFADRERNDRGKICAISALSYIKAEEWLRRRWGEVELPGKEDGINVYIADGATLDKSGNYYKAQNGIKVYLAGVDNLGEDGDGIKVYKGFKQHLKGDNEKDSI